MSYLGLRWGCARGCAQRGLQGLRGVALPWKGRTHCNRNWARATQPAKVFLVGGVV